MEKKKSSPVYFPDNDKINLVIKITQIYRIKHFLNIILKHLLKTQLKYI